MLHHKYVLRSIMLHQRYRTGRQAWQLVSFHLYELLVDS